jgi:SAM-dependent methyltransferase
MTQLSQRAYYEENHFNPASISLGSRAEWETHFAIRRNLYQRHLGIPLSLLKNSSVLEFGPASGENALVLAALGANLTLVEPNAQVLPRLKSQFAKLGLKTRIAELLQQDIGSFAGEGPYDLVIAEGFLNTLPNRDQMILKIAGLLAPGGLAVVSYTDRYGCLIELVKRMLLWRGCQLAGVQDVHSDASLEIARRLYGEEFAKLNGSRQFDVWWKDMLVTPFVASAHLWSYRELLPLIEAAGCEFYSSSPAWTSVDRYGWYKSVASRVERHARLLDDWARVFPFILTGLPLASTESPPAPREAIDGVGDLVAWLGEFTQLGQPPPIESMPYPAPLDYYLANSDNSSLARFNIDLKQLHRVALGGGITELVQEYRGADIKSLWGTPCHYVCFTKELDPSTVVN